MPPKRQAQVASMKEELGSVFASEVDGEDS